MPELATKAEQLFAELETLRSTPEINPFTFKRLQREANGLLKVDALSAYQILGVLSGFAGHIAEIRKNYERALQLATTSLKKSEALYNYAASLSYVGYFAESVEFIDQAQTLVTIPDFRLLDSVQMYSRAGLFHRAKQHIDKIELLDKELSKVIFSIMQFMDKHAVHDESYQKLLEIAVSVLHQHQFFNFHSRNIVIGFAEDDNSRWFRYVIKVNRPVGEIVEMKYELACQLAEMDLPLNLLSHFIVTYQCAEE